jgi:hypothetical protein
VIMKTPAADHSVSPRPATSPRSSTAVSRGSQKRGPGSTGPTTDSRYLKCE